MNYLTQNFHHKGGQKLRKIKIVVYDTNYRWI